jgi:predicted RNA binding protein YcfA (HicA-like mRNA interferase family)
MSGRDVRRLLEQHGFSFVRQRGSHMVMQKQEENTTVTAIVPNHDVLRIGTLQSIIRQSRLARELFEQQAN